MQSCPDKLKLFEHKNFSENHLISADSGTISVIQNKRWPSRLSLFWLNHFTAKADIV